MALPLKRSQTIEVPILTFEVREDQLEEPGLRRLWRVWSGLRAARGGALPARSQLDVVDLAECWGDLVVLDVVDGGRDFVYRLYGTNVADAYGYDLTGLSVRALPPSAIPFFFDYYSAICVERAACFCRRASAPEARVREWDRLSVPFAEDGQVVDRIFTAAYPRTPDR